MYLNEILDPIKLLLRNGRPDLKNLSLGLPDLADQLCESRPAMENVKPGLP